MGYDPDSDLNRQEQEMLDDFHRGMDELDAEADLQAKLRLAEERPPSAINLDFAAIEAGVLAHIASKASGPRDIGAQEFQELLQGQRVHRVEEVRSGEAEWSTLSKLVIEMADGTLLCVEHHGPGEGGLELRAAHRLDGRDKIWP